jgi:hypothetical protein
LHFHNETPAAPLRSRLACFNNSQCAAVCKFNFNHETPAPLQKRNPQRPFNFNNETPASVHETPTHPIVKTPAL